MLSSNINLHGEIGGAELFYNEFYSFVDFHSIALIRGLSINFIERHFNRCPHAFIIYSVLNKNDMEILKTMCGDNEELLMSFSTFQEYIHDK